MRFVHINDNDDLINIRIWKYHVATKKEKKKNLSEIENFNMIKIYSKNICTNLYLSMNIIILSKANIILKLLHYLQYFHKAIYIMFNIITTLT